MRRLGGREPARAPKEGERRPGGREAGGAGEAERNE